MIPFLKSMARQACTFGVLLAALAGCNNGNGDLQLPPESTFSQSASATNTPADQGKPLSNETTVTTNKDTVLSPDKPPEEWVLPTEPVTGTVTAVAGTAVTPEPGDGLAKPADPLSIFNHVTPPGAPPAPTRQIPAVPTVPVTEPASLPTTTLASSVLRLGRFVETAPDMGGAEFDASDALEYDLGKLLASTGGDVSSFSDDKLALLDIKGWVRYPISKKDSPAKARYPVVVMMHGQHSWIEPNYQGYDYLAADLATHGYIVLSIDANMVNGSPGGDASGQARGQLVLGTLDRLRQIDLNGQIENDGKTGLLDPLKGKFDFKRVGIMGHSRGGQGIASALKFNMTRRNVSAENLLAAVKARALEFKSYPDLISGVPAPLKYSDVARMKGIPEDILARMLPKTLTAAQLEEFAVTTLGYTPESAPSFRAAMVKYRIFAPAGSETTPPYIFRGAFLLAPTDFDGNLGITNVPLATLLPTCNGDMVNLEGARTFDHDRFANEYDTAPRYQILVRSANHNYYNEIWVADDYREVENFSPDAYCSADRVDTPRLTADDQRRGGLFLINSFMRYQVGGEQKFASYWNGQAALPAAACPTKTEGCDERVSLSIQNDSGRRSLIQTFAASDSLSTNLLGGSFQTAGFDAVARCDMPYGYSETAGSCSPDRLPDFEYTGYRTGGKGLLSIADHAELIWTKANASVTADLKGMSGVAFDSLTFRIAVVRPFSQEVLVTLTDSAGKSATLTASHYSDALYNGVRPRDGKVPMVDDPRDMAFNNGELRVLMNMVAIPLDNVEGIDVKSLKELKLTFPKEAGKVALTDIQLQSLGRPKTAELASQ